jgi:formylglycine-generating enzyme required for sulfatase activity
MKQRDEAGGARRLGRAIGKRPNHSTVVAYLALFVALGGTAWAVAANSVGTKQLKNKAVTTKKIENGAVTAPKLACKGEGAKDKMVRAGAVCIDKFEASVWSRPNGGVQYGVSGDDYPCNDNGQNCKGKLFARSVKGVQPSARITWFQAQQALANSGKRLPTNAEWQQAVAGTPDSTACNVSTEAVANTGANAGCVSRFGANDTVGNLWEWVADWVPRSTDCGNWGIFSDDSQCLAGAANFGRPGALIRGGDFACLGIGPFGSSAGAFAVSAGFDPSASVNSCIGFRGAR